MPLDLGQNRRGVDMGPSAIRYARLNEALEDLGYSVTDLGNVETPIPETVEEREDADNVGAIRDVCEETAERAARMVYDDIFPVFLGGDHSVSYPLLRAYDDVPGLHVVQLDAHLDFTDARNDTRFSNSSPFRRAAGELPNLASVTTLGLRGLRFDREAVAAARARGHRMGPRWELGTEAAVEAAAAALPQGAPVYLSIDVDALDPAVLPGTSSPEPDGLSYAALLALVRAAVGRNRPVGVDVVELAPALDPSGNSALLVARLVMEVLAAAFDP